MSTLSYFNAPLSIPNAKSLLLGDLDNSDYLQIKANDATTGYIIELPPALGNINQVLTINSNAAGVAALNWSDVVATSLAADNITIGASDVLLSTSSGNVEITASTGKEINLKISADNILGVDNSGVGILTTTESVGTSSGALIVSGGVGIAKNLTIGGNITITNDILGTASFLNDIIPSVADGASLGSSSFEWSDLYLADGGNIYMGNDQEVIITHIPDTGILLNDSSQLQFRDSGLYINSSVDGQLDINANNEIQLTSTRANISGTVYAAGVVNVENTTESVSTSSGALIVSGGVGVASNVNIGGNLSVSVDATITANTTLSGNFIQGVTSFLGSNTTQELWGPGKNTSIKSIYANTAAAFNYSSLDSVGYTTGQMMHIFFTNNSGGTANATVDFSTGNLYAGSGQAQYLTFDVTGQSASLIYLDGDDSVKGWRIINTGAIVS